jgi:hypothetical protein
MKSLKDFIPKLAKAFGDSSSKVDFYTAYYYIDTLLAWSFEGVNQDMTSQFNATDFLIFRYI